MNGQRCPRIEQAPQSLEGHAVLAALNAPGCWLRAGMGGTVTGLDMPQLLARLDEEIDPAIARRLATQAEVPAIAAIIARQQDQADGGDR